MIETKFGHIQFNVAQCNLPFYKDLFAFLGWGVLEDDPVMLGVGSTVFNSLWFFGSIKDRANDYDGPGMNHLALQAPTQSAVDQAVEYLREHNIPPLFETPRHRPEFAMDENHTYYQVMFESPARILFEVVYMGPKEK